LTGHQQAIALAALAIVLAACADESGPPPPARWRVAGNFLRDPQGRAVILRGVNLSGDHKAKPYLGADQPEDLARIRAWGFDAVRFVMTWTAVEPSRGQIDEGYLDELARRMEWARAADLLVVVDMHQDVFGEGFGGDGAPRWACDEEKYAAHKPTSPWFANYASPPVMACFDRLWTDAELGGRFAEAWRRVAARLAGAGAVVGFDVINEPHWGSYNMWTFEADRLAPFYGRVIDAVRLAADWVAFCEPAASRNLGIATSLPPFAQPDVVYAPHAYDALAEQGNGFDPARRGAILANLEGLAREARALGAPLWIGEHGGVAARPGIGEYMDANEDGASGVAAGTMFWHYGRDDGYGLLNPDGSDKAALLDALVRPYPMRVAGDPVRWSFDSGGRVFRLTMSPDAAVAAPTEISVPDRVYPGGVYRPRCDPPDRCSFETAAGILRVRLDGASRDPLEIIVEP